MNICLVSSKVSNPTKSKDEKFESYFVYTSIDNAYIAAYLEQLGHSVDVIEGELEKKEEIKEKIVTNKYDVVGISIYYFNYVESVRLIKVIRKRLPEVFIFSCGYYSTLKYQDLLNDVEELDCCIIGEGEITASKLIDNMNNKDIWCGIPGLAYKYNGEIIRTEKAKLIENLDVLPFPKRPYQTSFMASIISARGCYGECSFCSGNDMYKESIGSRVRIRSAKNVVDEMRYLSDSFKVTYFDFKNENFMNCKDNNWVFDFVTEVKAHGLKGIKFSIFARANDVMRNQNQLKLLHDVGLDYIFVGIESFIDRQLKLYNKGITSQVNLESLAILASENIKYVCGFIPLDPFVVFDELRINFNTLIKIGFPNHAHFMQVPISCLEPLYAGDGSKLFEVYKSENVVDHSNSYRFEFIHENVIRFNKALKTWRQAIFTLNKKIIGLLMDPNINSERRKTFLAIKPQILLLDLRAMLVLCDDIELGVSDNVQKSFYDEIVELENTME